MNIVFARFVCLFECIIRSYRQSICFQLKSAESRQRYNDDLSSSKSTCDKLSKRCSSSDEQTMLKRLQECLALCVQDRFFRCLLPWHASLVAASFAISYSLYNLLWSIANLIDEDDVLIFFLMIVLLLDSIIIIIASILVAVAVFKRVAVLLLPWLIAIWIDILIGFTLRFVELSAPPRPPIRPCIFSLASLFVTTILSVFLLYCWMAVYSYYREIIEYTSNFGARHTSTAIQPVRNGRIKPTLSDKGKV